MDVAERTMLNTMEAVSNTLEARGFRMVRTNPDFQAAMAQADPVMVGDLGVTIRLVCRNRRRRQSFVLTFAKITVREGR